MILFILNYETGVCYKHALTDEEVASLGDDCEDFVIEFMCNAGMRYDDCYWMLSEEDIEEI